MKTLNVISLGAGVQSSVMALMAAHGELPRPDCAIFADTQWEPQGVYDHLDWLESVISNPLLVENTFPIYRVTAGNIYEDAIAGVNSTGTAFATLPFFSTGNVMARRQCTNEYKIKPIRQKIRSLLGLKKGQRVPKDKSVKQWIGISTDEASRMKPSRDKWCENTFPLIDKQMSRRNCMTWFEKHYSGRVLAKSACKGCPFNNDKRWRDMKLNQPNDFAEVVNFDEKIRKPSNHFNKEFFIHSSRQPLSEVDLRNLEDKGQINMFENECEGMCGL
tara:strand:- start:43 stop:867 length:825 start_codon:yes stop_codon:yes gene_type:complete